MADSDFYTKELLESTDTYTKYHISAMVHGKKNNQPVPNTQCGAYPYIYLIFDITCTRSGDTVNFLIDNVVWNSDSAHNVSGRYGYYFQAKIGVGDDLDDILYKNNTTEYQWWNYVSVDDEIELSYDTDSDTVDLDIYAGGINGNGCFNSSIPCYGSYGGGSDAGKGEKFLYSIALDVPQNTVTLTYNENSSVASTPNPTTQQISRTVGTEIHSVTTYPFIIKYHDGDTVLLSETVNRTFSGWNEKSDGSGTMHQNGQSITLSDDDTFYARWGVIPFTVKNITQMATVIFHSNGGSYCQNLTVPRGCGGYSRTVGSSEIEYVVGSSSSLPADTNYNVGSQSLYGIFNTVNYDSDDLPEPTRNKYVFDGWYYDSALTQKVGNTLTVNARTIDLYAKWREFPVKRRTASGWEPVDRYVWKMTTSGWQKIAPIYIMEDSGTWNNISE